MIIGIIAGVIIAAGVAGIVFVNRPQFGRLPAGRTAGANQKVASLQGRAVP